MAIIIGAIAGGLAGQLVQGTGFGLPGDILIGIAGGIDRSAAVPEIGLASWWGEPSHRSNAGAWDPSSVSTPLADRWSDLIVQIKKKKDKQGGGTPQGAG